MKKFKNGEYNVLVATSIGEEGLDIGEVDLIVCYDAQKTPIRMVRPLTLQEYRIQLANLFGFLAPTSRTYWPETRWNCTCSSG